MQGVTGSSPVASTMSTVRLRGLTVFLPQFNTKDQAIIRYNTDAAINIKENREIIARGMGMKKNIVGLLCIAFLLSFAGCSDISGKIRKINQSPMGSYQIDEVTWSRIFNSGESYLVVESPFDSTFSSVGDGQPASGILIEETRCSEDTNYSVIWDSETTFVAKWASPESYSFDVARVELTGDGYEISCGNVHIEDDGSFLSDYKVDGDDVYFNCNLKITNESSEDVRFTINGIAESIDIGRVLDDGHLVAVNDDRKPQVFDLAANSSDYYYVSFIGRKGPKDKKFDRLLPAEIKLNFIE